MKTMLKILGLVVLVLVILAVVLPRVISLDDIADSVTDRAAANTGRTLTIDGEKSLSVFPSLALQLHGVRVANMEGGSRPDMITMESLDVHIPWLSLLSGELSVEKFVINNPDILLETDSRGNVNWDVAPAGEPAEEPADGAALPAGFDISFGEVAIYGGRVTLLDHQAGTEQVLEDLELSIGLPSLREELELQGSVTYMGEVLQLDVTLATPARAMSSQSIDVTVALDSRLVSVEYAGIISGGGSAAKGSLKVAGDSVKELAAWQGEPLEAGANAFNQFSLTSEVGFVDQSLALTALKATLDELEFVGETTVTLSDPPDIQAQFDLGMLDLNPYLPAEPAAADDSPAVSAAAPAQPVVWDDTPLDLAALKSVNARLTVTSSGLKAGDITLGENALQLTLKGGRMTVALEKFVAYQGQGTGEVVVDASRSPYAITTNFGLAGVNAQPLLTDAVGFDKLLGTGKLDWKLTTAGRSQKDFMGGLNGSLSFSFTDGAVKGANLAALVRSAEGIMQGDISSVSLDQGFDKAQQTDFSEMGGSMQFKQGIGNNQDLSLASPLLRIKGQGKVNLPKATVDYALNARLVESIEGQGAGKKAKGVAIPVRIKGPFHKVKIKPDVSKAAEEKVKASLKDELFKRFGNKDKKS